MKKEEIKKIVKNNIILRPIYLTFSSLKQRRHIVAKEKGKEKFICNSKTVINDVQRLFSKYSEKIDFFFGFGTLLGIIRDGKLISSDMDIDLVVFFNDDDEIMKFRSFLHDNSFTRLYSCKIKELGITQDAFLFKDIMIDINYAKKYENKYCNYLFYDLPDVKNKIIVFPFSFKNTILHEFENNYINVPSCPEKYLSEIYGEDWKEPNPNYIYWENPQSIKTEIIGEIEIIEKFKYS